MPKRFGHSSFVLLTVASAFCFTGCRTATDGLARIPGLGWMNRSDEQWAKYEPAPGLPRPSELAEPTDPSDPTSGPGVSGIASSDQLRGSASRSFDKVASKLDGADADRFDASPYMPKSNDSGSELGSKYAAAYGKYGPPKSLNATAKDSKPKFGAPQTGPYDVESPKSAPKFAAASGGDEKFAKNGYDLGYEPYKPATNSKPYVSPSSGSGDSESKSPYGYASGNRFESPAKAINDTATKVAQTASQSLPKFEPGSYSTPKFNNNYATTANDKLSQAATTASEKVASAKGGLVNGLNNAVANAKDTAAATTNRFNANANQLAGSLNNAANNVANNATSNANGFGNQLANAAQQTNQFANNAANQIQNGTQQTYNRFAAGAKAQANTAVNSAQNALGQFANNAANTAQSLAPPKSTQPAPNFGNYAATTANQFANTAKSAVNSVTNNGTFGSNAAQPTAGFGQATQGLSQAATQSIADAKKAIAGNANAAAQSLSAQAGQATNAVANQFNQFAKNATNAVQNKASNSLNNAAGNIQQQAVGQFQTYAQQAQQKAEQAVTNTYGQAKQNLEQSVASQYQQAKNAVGQYANSAVNAAQNQASNFAGSVANSVSNNSTFQSAAAALGNAQQKFAGATSTANRAMQNVSAPMAPSYPSTTTPNPYVVPGSQIKGAANRFSPQQMNQPSATSNPAAAPSNYNIPPATDGPAFRTATPFLPGSTQSFQGAQTTTRKPNLQSPTVKLASATSEATETDEQLVLAVGDKYQFPRTLR